MKKHLSVLAVMLMLTLAACSGQKISSVPAGSAGDAPADSITALDEGVWPDNEYTAGLPVPPGTVTWAALDAEHKNCSVNLTGVSESDFDGYMEALAQDGFSVIENVSEEIKGEAYVSSGTLLSNGEKGISISYVPGSLTIYIAFENG